MSSVRGWIGGFALLALAVSGCTDNAETPLGEAREEAPASAESSTMAKTGEGGGADGAPVTATEVATFGAGCFWCVEAVLEQLDGVSDVSSGYMGGKIPNPTYEQVCTGTTDHAEVVQVTFDPARISYDELLAMFWRLHDPTTLNRQGADSGTQYRSVIFWHSEAQRDAAERSLRAEDASGRFADPIVTQIAKADEYYEAEVSHQDYYRLNRSKPYCQAVIRPKLEKLKLEP